MKLSDFPQFTVQDAILQDGGWVLKGIFNHLDGVRQGRSWLYREGGGGTDSLIGDLTELDPETRHARFDTPDVRRPLEPLVGSALPWLDGYWQAPYINLILDPGRQWQRTLFRASDAIEVRTDKLRRWRKARADDVLAEREVRVPSGWDHEHCTICRTKIGASGEPVGYTDDEDNWLCSACYEKWAMPHDLGFVRGGLG